MGERKKRREAFFSKHQVCCFCGGLKSATTIEHRPPRAAFNGRQYPKEFEFPACDACNAAAREDDQIFSAWVRMLDPRKSYSSNETKMAISGLKNNYPNFLPNLSVTANDPLLRLSSFQNEMLYKANEEYPIGLPIEFEFVVERQAKLLLKALFYKELDLVLPQDAGIFVIWITNIQDEFKQSLSDIFGKKILLGGIQSPFEKDRFQYRVGVGAQHGLFGFFAEFNPNIRMFGYCNYDRALISDDEWNDLFA